MAEAKKMKIDKESLKNRINTLKEKRLSTLSVGTIEDPNDVIHYF